MKAEAILFDLDGVVVFSDKYHYLGWKQLADELGWTFDETMNHKLRGVSRMESLAIILQENNVSLPEEECVELATKKNAYYVQLLSNLSESDLYPDVLDLLNRLKARGLRLALCSSSKNANAVLDALNLNDYFEVVVTGADITRTKPHPEIFLKASDAMGIPPEACIVFEDAPSGVEAAHAAGMRCVGVGPEERLGDAEWIVTDYNDLDLDTMLADATLEPETV